MPANIANYASDVERRKYNKKTGKFEKWTGYFMFGTAHGGHETAKRIARLMRKTGIKARVIKLPDTGMLGMVERSVVITLDNLPETASAKRLERVAEELEKLY